MADHELDAIRQEFVGNRNALLRIGNVVTNHDLDHFAVDATGSIDVGSSLLGTLLQLSAKSGVRAGDRTGNADQKFSPGCAAECHHGGEGNAREQSFLSCDNSHWVFEGLFLTGPRR